MKKGFTLLEILIAIAILGILTMIAFPSYTAYIRKGRRADGLNTILAISLAEEQYRTNNSQYGTLAQVWNNVTTTPEGYYTLTITNVSATRYTITASAVGTQTNDNVGGTSCSNLVLDMNNGTTSKTPAACWPT